MTFLPTLLLTLQGPIALATAPHPLQEALDRPASGLELVYDDTHGPWGGTRCELAAEGELTCTVTPEGFGTPVERSVKLTPGQLQELAGLLASLEVWEQRVPPRTPVPGETKAELTVAVGGTEASMWEWYNDMGANDRLAQIKGWLDARAGAR